MTSRHEALDAAIAAVDEADDALPFSDLVRIAAQGRAFDKARHMRFGDWSDVDLEKSKLVGFDFTGAHIIGCKFAGASIAGARFDKAIIDIVQPYAKLDPQRTSLRAAADWGAYVKSWRRSDNPPDDSHLPIGAIFQDAPFAPEMVVVPPGTYMRGSMEQQYSRPVREVTIAHRFAVGRFPVTFEEGDFSQKHTEWQRLSHQELRYPDVRQWGRRRR
ncbi:MAG: SUMF1/EgtB/PvdO family nonheme iron enzyme, partial [Hyphomicrobiaceae bacterium]